MKSKAAKIVSLESWIEEYSEMLSVETMRLIDAHRGLRGHGAADAVAVQVLANFTYLTVMNCLAAASSQAGTDEDRYDITSQALAAQKIEIQNAVASAFSDAMEDFSGRSVEYYCQIKVVPEPANRQSN